MKTAQKLSSKKPNTTASMIIFAVAVLSFFVFNLSSKIVSSAFAQSADDNKEQQAAPISATESILTMEPAPVVDQKQVTLTAIPPRIGEDSTLKAKPGEKLQVQLRVKNLSSQAVNVTTTAQDFILSEDGSTPIAIDDTSSNRWSLASWLTIIPNENTIAPNETVGLNVLIEIPQDALPGGHYAMVLHQPNKVGGGLELQGDSESAVNQRVGTLIYVVVDGVINEEAYLRNFTFPEFSEYGPVPFSFTVENNSDVHITPQMNIEIFDIFNRKVDDIQVSPKNIFPITSREFSGEWKRIWGFGPYNAKLVMSYGNKGSIVVANSSFWLLPIKLVVAGLTALLTIIILLLSIKKHLNHRKEMDRKKIEELENQIQEIGSRESDHDDTLEQ